MLRSFSLRNKLLLAVGIPMIVLAIGAVLVLRSAQNSASDARSQSEEVTIDLDVVALADRLRDEQAATLRGSQTEVFQSRVDSDDAFDKLLASTNDEQERVQVTEIRSVLDETRPRLRGDATFIQRRIVSNKISGLAEQTLGLISISDEDYGNSDIALQVSALIDIALWKDAVVSERNGVERLLNGGEATVGRQLNLLEQTVAAEEAQRVAESSSIEGLDFTEFTESVTVAPLRRLREEQRNGDVESLRIINVSFIKTASDKLIDGIEEEQGDLAQRIRDTNQKAADDAAATQRNVVLGSLVGVLLMALLLFFLYRAITSPITALSRRGRKLATEDLPATVERFRTEGADAEFTEITPLTSETDDEVGELVEVFNELHVTAINLAAEQARSRKVASDMFVNLGHRNQKILTTVLQDLDELERDENDPDRLGRLYSVDQKVTRMRRNAESLLVLAGTKTPRQWAQPAPLGDVVRAAMSEVENFERVESEVDNSILVSGNMVADLTHLLAELIENSLRFSPPTENVTITSTSDEDGQPSIMVTDRGFGMNSEKLEEANNRIIAAADKGETPSKHLGLYVVGRLASRHGIEVELVDNDSDEGLVAQIDLGAAVANTKSKVSEKDAQTAASLGSLTATKPEAKPATNKYTEAAKARARDSEESAKPAGKPTPPDTTPDPSPAKKPATAKKPAQTQKAAPAEKPPARKPAPVEEPAAAKMPKIEPAIPPSEEVKTHSDQSPKQPAPPSSETQAKPGGPRERKRRVPGASLPSSLKKAPTEEQEPPTNKASASELQNAFTGFQKSSKPSPKPKTQSGGGVDTTTQSQTTQSQVVPPETAEPPKRVAPPVERATPPPQQATPSNKPRERRRRVPGASLHPSLQKKAKPAETPPTPTHKSDPDQVRNAFSGFQKSASPSTERDQVDETESDNS